MMNPQHGRQRNVSEITSVNLQTTCWKSEGDHLAYVMRTCNRRKYTRLQRSLSPHRIEWLRRAFCTAVWRGVFLVWRNSRYTRFWTWTRVKFAFLLHSAPHHKHVWGGVKLQLQAFLTFGTERDWSDSRHGRPGKEPAISLACGSPRALLGSGF
jgi:hypothetical protein